MLDFSQTVLDGLVNGAIIALAALGITIVFSISRFANVAHGDLMTFGAYIGLMVNLRLGGGLFTFAAGAMVVTIIVGLMIHRVVFRPIERRSSVALLITSIGLSLIIRNVIAWIWGFDIRGYDLPIERPNVYFGLRITPSETLILFIAIAAMILFFFLLRGTRIGKEMRAVSDLPDLARVTGIDTARVTRWVWTWALGTAALAGVLLGVKTILTPNMGWDLLLPAFAATILGGIGNPAGAVLGAFIVSVAQELSTYVVSDNYKQMIAFGILILVLLWRPGGLFGRKGRL